MYWMGIKKVNKLSNTYTLMAFIGTEKEKHTVVESLLKRVNEHLQGIEYIKHQMITHNLMDMRDFPTVATYQC